MTHTSAWQHFLSDARIGDPYAGSSTTEITATSSRARSEFHKDYDRIIFSDAFRQLSQKTQVVPFPETAYTRQRLTHSLEVSCVGRSLATHVYHMPGEDIAHVCALGDFEAIVAAACLAHDIGNPPFGHFGEKAIQDWATRNLSEPKFSTLTEAQRADLERFEGNAQTFRILTRLQMSRPGGMRLTAATLGAVIKYPTFSTLAKKHRYRKHGCFLDDADLFAKTFAEVQRVQDNNGEYARHPLALLSEAADDICYAIIDLEDGCRAGLIPTEHGCEVLEGIGKILIRATALPPADKISMGRALAINVLVEQCVEVFRANTDAIMGGTFSGSLIDHCPAADAYRRATQLVCERVFRNARVLEAEAAGYRAIQGLLDILVPAAMADTAKGYDAHVLQIAGIRTSSKMSAYQRVLACTDYVSGMTDGDCLRLFKRLTGHSAV